MNKNNSHPANIIISIIDSLLDNIYMEEIMEEYGLTEEDILSDIGSMDKE